MKDEIEIERILASVKPIRAPESVSSDIFAALQGNRIVPASSIPLASAQRFYLRTDFISFASAVCLLIAGSFALFQVNAHLADQLYSVYETPRTPAYLFELQQTIAEVVPAEAARDITDQLARDLQSIRQPPSYWDYSSIQITTCTSNTLQALTAEERPTPSLIDSTHDQRSLVPGTGLFYRQRWMRHRLTA